MNDFKVDFIGIGAPKCATTWISDCLKEHPEINFAKTKETDFFTRSLFVYHKKIPYHPTFNDYKKEFEHDNNGLKGEFSVSYIYDVEAPKRIKQMFPDVKIIVSLRNPVDMIYSRYWYEHPYKRKDFMTVIKKDPSYKEMGFLYKYLKNYYDVFDKNNIHVILADEIKKNRLRVIQNLYRFLGVDDSFIPASLNRRSNTTTRSRFYALTMLAKGILLILRKMKLYNIIHRYLNPHSPSILVKLYYKINEVPFNYPKLTPEERRKILPIYIEDIEKLEKLIGKDLSAWKTA